jgi:tetratricopeptide (TPR) repeat protein
MEKSQLHKAEEHIMKGMKMLDQLKTKPGYSMGHLLLGELCADAGQKEKALENLKKAEELYQEMGMDHWLARTRRVLEAVHEKGSTPAVQ